MYGSVREKGNYGVWEMLNLSFSCIFSVVTGDWCACNCNTWAHLVRIWRHGQNSTCQFLFHRQVTWMTDPPSPMWSHIQHMVTITLSGASFQSTLWLICFRWKGALGIVEPNGVGPPPRLNSELSRSWERWSTIWPSGFAQVWCACCHAKLSVTKTILTNPRPIRHQNYMITNYMG